MEQPRRPAARARAEAGELMDEARDDVLASAAFPHGHSPRIASPIEQRGGGIKRGSGVAGVCPTTKAVVRLVGMLMLEQNDAWAVSRRDTTLEGLVAFSDAPKAGLSAVAARPSRTYRASTLLHRQPGRERFLSDLASP